MSHYSEDPGSKGEQAYQEELELQQPQASSQPMNTQHPENSEDQNDQQSRALNTLSVIKGNDDSCG